MILLGPHLLVLFLEVLESWGGEALMEEVGYCGWVFAVYYTSFLSVSPCVLCILVHHDVN